MIGKKNVKFNMNKSFGGTSLLQWISSAEHPNYPRIPLINVIVAIKRVEDEGGGGDI